jgi:hypothetical protein
MKLCSRRIRLFLFTDRFLTCCRKLRIAVCEVPGSRRGFTPRLASCTASKHFPSVICTPSGYVKRFYFWQIDLVCPHDRKPLFGAQIPTLERLNFLSRYTPSHVESMRLASKIPQWVARRISLVCAYLATVTRYRISEEPSALPWNLF